MIASLLGHLLDGSTPVRTAAFSACVICCSWSSAFGDPQVVLERVPENGIQPRIVVGTDGTAHLMFFKGPPAAGDLFYCRRGPTEGTFSTPIRINSEPSSAIAMGTIRGGQLALGQNNRVHVVWNGSDRAVPRGPNDETPLLYARQNDDRSGFDAQINLIDEAYGLDGGACIAADSSGNVYVAWHAGHGRGESARRIWLARSQDDGKTFEQEYAIDEPRVGACSCCGMQGTVSPTGEVMFLYRSAQEEVNRDMHLLTSSNRGKSFKSQRVHRWEIATCPMTSAAFVHTPDVTWAAWETAAQIFLQKSVGNRGHFLNAQPISDPSVHSKHPSLAADQQGRILVVWTEGTGWKRGGSLAWQICDPEGQVTEVQGKAPGIPAWSFAAALTRPDGSFVILY